MSPDYMQHTLHLMAGRGLIDLRETAARARGVDDACTVGDPTGQPSANPGETQRVPNSTESGTGPENGTVPDFPGNTPENGPLSGKTGEFNTPECGGIEGCAIRTPAGPPAFRGAALRKLADLHRLGYQISGYAFEKQIDFAQQPVRGFITSGGFVGWWRDDTGPEPVTKSHAESRPDSVTSRDPAVTLSQSVRQSLAGSLAGSLPPTLHQESEPMNAKPLQPTVTLDGQPAAGEAIIRQLIKELGHCQEQLAACLPDVVGARRTAETGNPASDHFDGATQADDQRAKAGSEGAVHALVSSALQAHDHHLVLLQAESTQVRVQIEQVTARRREFMDFLQTGVARP